MLTFAFVKLHKDCIDSTRSKCCKKRLFGKKIFYVMSFLTIKFVKFPSCRNIRWVSCWKLTAKNTWYCLTSLKYLYFAGTIFHGGFSFRNFFLVNRPQILNADFILAVVAEILTLSWPENFLSYYNFYNVSLPDIEKKNNIKSYRIKLPFRVKLWGFTGLTVALK